MAKGVNAKGLVVGPRLAFTTRDKQATAVIGLGKDAPEGTLTVAWYRLVEAGRHEHFFSHKIPVGPGVLAYSQGVAKGGLAPGLYETVAQLGERQVRTPWVVRRGGSAEKVSAPASDSAASVLVSSRSAQATPSWDLPGPGESGVSDPDDWPLPEGGVRDTCEVDLNSGWAAYDDLSVYAFGLGPCSTLTLSAAVTGAPITIGSEGPPITGGVFGRAGLCLLPGGSDLPGTVVRIEATGSAIARQNYVVEDHGEGLIAGVESIPGEGTKVAPGDRIKLHALALLIPPAQGIKVLYVDDGNDLIESVGNASGATEPVSCDLGRYVAELFAEYRVPADPPPVIEICAHAEGFDSVRAQGCIEFYTGEVWEGPVTGQTTQPGCSPARVPVTGDLRIVVGNNGTVAGSLTYKREAFSCGGTEAPAFESSYPISGRKAAAAFELRVSGTSVTMPISGMQASKTFTQHGSGGYSATVTATIDCVSCDEAAG